MPVGTVDAFEVLLVAARPDAQRHLRFARAVARRRAGRPKIEPPVAFERRRRRPERRHRRAVEAPAHGRAIRELGHRRVVGPPPARVVIGVTGAAGAGPDVVLDRARTAAAAGSARRTSRPVATASPAASGAAARQAVTSRRRARIRLNWPAGADSVVAGPAPRGPFRFKVTENSRCHVSERRLLGGKARLDHGARHAVDDARRLGLGEDAPAGARGWRARPRAPSSAHAGQHHAEHAAAAAPRRRSRTARRPTGSTARSIGFAIDVRGQPGARATKLQVHAAARDGDAARRAARARRGLETRRARRRRSRRRASASV